MRNLKIPSDTKTISGTIKDLVGLDGDYILIDEAKVFFENLPATCEIKIEVKEKCSGEN